MPQALQRRVLPGGATLIEGVGDGPGPTLALLGGVHGDEDEGVLAVHRVLATLADRGFRGRVRAVAPAHPAAWAAFSRTSPIDGANLARCFPGDPEGDPSARLARGITDEVIAGADLLIDLHSAGVRYAMPLMCGYVRGMPEGARSREAAEAFGAPILWTHEHAGAGRSLSAAAELGIPAIYAECGGGGEIRFGELEVYVQGVLNAMAWLGMLEAGPATPSAVAGRREVFGSGDLDDGAQAGLHGWFVTSVTPGTPLRRDEEIGRLFDHAGQMRDIVRAPRDGIVMFLRRHARVRPEDVLYVMGRLENAG